MGSDPPSRTACGTICRFNSRSRMGSDDGGAFEEGGGHVSIHAPAWGATRAWPSGSASCRSFNSRSRMGSDGEYPAGKSNAHVSIHAPAWGATAGRLPKRRWTPCFNSRSRMGSDGRRPRRPGRSSRFNSRSRMGSDKGRSVEVAPHRVSIHAPAWGATRRRQPAGSAFVVTRSRPTWGQGHWSVDLSTSVLFQFTLPHGERLDDGSRRGQLLQVQFALPHGMRRVAQSCPAAVCSFNSRSRMGSDLRAGPAPAVLGVSIHAPAWGATQCPSSCAITFAFQFTLPHGERHGCASTSASSGCFNSRSRMGSDSAPRQQVAFSCSFQFTLPHGERQERLEKEAEELKFQFTLPHGERRGRRAARTGGRRFNSRSRMGSDSAGCGRL